MEILKVKEFVDKRQKILTLKRDLIKLNILTGNKPNFGLEFKIVNGKILTKTIKK